MLSWHNEDFAGCIARAEVICEPPSSACARQCRQCQRAGPISFFPWPIRRCGALTTTPPPRARRRSRARAPSALDDAERRTGRRADARQPRRRGLRAGALQRAGADDARCRRCGGSSSRPRAKRPTTWPGHAQRLRELGARPSLLNPLWYAGAFAIGLLAGRAGDATSLGFVVETERQVEQPPRRPSRPPSGCRPAVARDRQPDEGRRGRPRRRPRSRPARRRCRGRSALAMRAAARVMTTTAHYV